MSVQGMSANTVALLPTRQFTFVLDPECVPLILKQPYPAILSLITDLKQIDPPVQIHLILPAYLATPTIGSLLEKLSYITKQIPAPKDALLFKPDGSVPEEIRRQLLDSSEESKRAISLLALAETIQADGILTRSDVLVEGRYVIYQHHRIRIIPLNEFADLVEICAHGFSIFWSASRSDRYFTLGVFYPWVHWKNARYSKWFNNFREVIKDKELEDSLRSALLNRYPFLLYSRDLMRFYDLQKDYYYRRDLFQRFGMAIGYYVTYFYLLLWGMMDHLTVIAKRARGLRIKEEHCSIRGKTFWKEFSLVEPGLSNFIASPRIMEWINVMADMRHAAAHRTMALPTPLHADTEESKKSDEEILKIIRKENSFMYSALGDEIMKSLEPQMIWHWRIKKMKVIAPGMVFVKKEEGVYMRDPVISVDRDMEYLTAIIDGFLVALFR